MSEQTMLADVTNQIQKFWSPMFMDQLKESTLLAGLVNKDYQGEIKKGGDQVRVSQINRPEADLLSIGVDADTFNATKLSTSYIDIQANKRVVAAFEFEDLVDVFSQIGEQNSKIRQSLVEACEIKLNEYLFGLVSPSSSSPDHIVSGVTDFNAAQLNAIRMLAAQAKWRKEGGWWLLSSPSYMSDMLNSSTLVSADFVAGEAPVIGGQIARQRFGFNILEDNSDAILTLGSTGTDCALAFHPDFMHLVMQPEPRFLVSPLHSQKKFGYVISVDFWCGAKLGIDGDKKHIKIYNS
jgi:hypothetical protein